MRLHCASACYDFVRLISVTMNTSALALTKKVGSKILILRNQKVILDTDLAELYGVSVK